MTVARHLTDTETVALEALIDVASLGAVLDAIVEICHGKAEHLQVNWQDTNASLLWDKAAKRVDVSALSAAVVDVS